MDRAESQRARGVIAWEKAHPEIATIDLQADTILTRFEDAAMELPWKKAVAAVGLEYGFTDETGRPLTPWAFRLLARARRAHTRARREHLEHEKRRIALFGSSPATPDL
jgi:hypothetical protein